MLPNPRQCTVSPRNPAGADVTCTGYRRPWTQADVVNFGSLGIESENAVFLLAVDTLNGVVPQGGWHLTDDEQNVWNILGRTAELEGAMYRCPVKKIATLA